MMKRKLYEIPYRRRSQPTKIRADKNEKLDISRHPITIAVIGFVLTGVLGAFLSSWITIHQKSIEREHSDREARKTAVQNLSRYIYERRSRAEMLASALRRNASLDEIRDRKKLYDEAYVKWNTNNQANLFLVREVLREDEYTLFESIIEFTLVGKILAPMDSCLTRAYDGKLNNEDPLNIIENCKMRALIQQALDCGYAITDELYKLSGDVTNRSSAKTEIDNRCLPRDRIGTSVLHDTSLR
jgi:hypothetical protein